MSQQLSLPAAALLQSLLDGQTTQALVISPNAQSFKWVDDFNPTATTRLVAFGAELDGEKIHLVLTAICADFVGQLTAFAYQPVKGMKPALVVEGLEYSDMLKALAIALAEELAIELTLVENAPSLAKPGVLLMDMDSTAIQIECIDEIAVLAGVGEQVAAVTKRAMQGELDFAQSLIERVGTLTGADEGVLKQVADVMPLMPGLESLVETLKQKGWVVAIASGGFTYFTERLKQQLGLTATFANVLEIVDGKLTGKVLGDIVDAQVKAEVVEKLAMEHGIDKAQTVAIGDGANDLKMLAQAALGVAFHAKPLVREKARSAVNQGGLEQLLYLLK